MQFIFVSKVITACDQLQQALTPQGDASYRIYLSTMSTSCGFNANKTITNAPWPHSFQFQPYHLKRWGKQTKGPPEILYYSLSPVRRRQADLSFNKGRTCFAQLALFIWVIAFQHELSSPLTAIREVWLLQQGLTSYFIQFLHWINMGGEGGQKTGYSPIWFILSGILLMAV